MSPQELTPGGSRDSCPTAGGGYGSVGRAVGASRQEKKTSLTVGYKWFCFDHADSSEELDSPISVIWKQLDRQEEWADRNLLKFSRDESEVLPLGRSSPLNETVWALPGREQLCCEGPGEQQAEHEPALAAKAPGAPGLYKQGRARIQIRYGMESVPKVRHGEVYGVHGLSVSCTHQPPQGSSIPVQVTRGTGSRGQIRP